MQLKVNVIVIILIMIIMIIITLLGCRNESTRVSQFDESVYVF